MNFLGDIQKRINNLQNVNSEMKAELNSKMQRISNLEYRMFVMRASTLNMKCQLFVIQNNL